MMYSRWLPYDCRERAWNDGYYGKFPSAVIFNSCLVFILIYLQTQGRFTEKDLPGLHFNLSTALEAKTPTPIHPLHSFNLKKLFFIPNTWEVEWMWGTDNASSIRTRGRKGWEEKRNLAEIRIIFPGLFKYFNKAQLHCSTALPVEKWIWCNQ